MRFIVTLVVASSFVASALGQTAPSAATLIESRQAEVASLGQMLYGIDVNRGTWVHHEAAICPAFTHHAFARYDRTDGDHGASSFIAIYSLDTPPAKSLNKPWQGGIVLLPLVEYHAGKPLAAIERPSAIVTFNHIWQDELQKSGHPDRFPGLTWGGLADCLVALTDEQPQTLSMPDADSDMAPMAIDLKRHRISSILVPLVSSNPNGRAVSLDFDAQGMVSSATLTESAKVKTTTSPSVPQPKQTYPPPHHPA